MKSRTSIYSFIDQALVSGSNLLLGFLIVRIGDLSLFGTFSLYFMAITLSIGVQQALIIQPMQSIYPKLKQGVRNYGIALNYMQAVYVLLIVIGGLILFGIQTYFAFDFPISLIFAGAAFVTQEYIRKRKYLRTQIRTILVLDGIAYGGMCLGIFLIGQWDVLTLENIFWVMATSFSLAGLWSFFSNKISMGSLSLAEFTSYGLRHWSQARWLLSAQVLQFFTGNFLLIAAAELLSHSALGAVRIVQSLMGLVHIVLLSTENFLPAQMAKSIGSHDKNQLFFFFKKYSKQLILICLPLLLGITVGGDILLKLWYGSAAEAAFELILPFCLLYLFIIPGYPLRYALRALEKTQAFLWAYAASSLFLYLSADYMLAQWGILAVPLGLLAAQLLMQSIYLFSFIKTIRNHENHSSYIRESTPSA